MAISYNYLPYRFPKVQPKRTMPATNEKKLIPNVDGLCDESLSNLLEK
jgi:uncharacterized protein (DUF4213/DUF364 family)